MLVSGSGSHRLPKVTIARPTTTVFAVSIQIETWPIFRRRPHGSPRNPSMFDFIIKLHGPHLVRSMSGGPRSVLAQLWPQSGSESNISGWTLKHCRGSFSLSHTLTFRIVVAKGGLAAPRCCAPLPSTTRRPGALAPGFRTPRAQGVQRAALRWTFWILFYFTQ